MCIGKILIRFAYKNRPAYLYLYKYTGLLFCHSDILRNTTSLRLIKNFANFSFQILVKFFTKIPTNSVPKKTVDKIAIFYEILRYLDFLLLKEQKPLIFL